MNPSQSIHSDNLAQVCPDCRLIFRLSPQHEGRGVLCPSCRRLLRLPQQGDKVQSLVLPAPDATESSATPHPYRVREKKSNEAADWEQSNDAVLEHKLGDEKIIVWALSGLVGLVALMGGVLLFLKMNSKPQHVIEKATLARSSDSISQEKRKLEDMKDLPKLITRNQNDTLKEVRKLADTFFSATTIDEILPVIRNPEEVKAKLLKKYPDGKITPTKLLKFNEDGNVAYNKDLLAIKVLINDHETKQLACVDTPQGLKIDWECWVAWCDMSMEDFCKTRPTTPQTFRVILEQDSYYNFRFAEESKWSCFTIRSVGSDKRIYAYLDRESGFLKSLNPTRDASVATATLRIHFPPNATEDDQVIIDSIVCDGWCTPNSEKK